MPTFDAPFEPSREFKATQQEPFAFDGECDRINDHTVVTTTAFIL